MTACAFGRDGLIRLTTTGGVCGRRRNPQVTYLDVLTSFACILLGYLIAFFRIRPSRATNGESATSTDRSLDSARSASNLEHRCSEARHPLTGAAEGDIFGHDFESACGDGKSPLPSETNATVAPLPAAVLIAENRQLKTELAIAKSEIDTQRKQIATYIADARTDELTGLLNRRGMNQELARCFERLVERGEAVSLLLVDIDDFKAINDEFGHVAGDQVLQQIATFLNSSVRMPSRLARYGGDEFALILPCVHIVDATRKSVQLHRSIANCPFLVENRQHRITVSVGVTEGTIATDSTALVKQACECLMLAKRSGKNRGYYHDGASGRPIASKPPLPIVDNL